MTLLSESHAVVPWTLFSDINRPAATLWYVTEHLHLNILSLVTVPRFHNVRSPATKLCSYVAGVTYANLTYHKIRVTILIDSPVQTVFWLACHVKTNLISWINSASFSSVGCFNSAFGRESLSSHNRVFPFPT